MAAGKTVSTKALLVLARTPAIDLLGRDQASVPQGKDRKDSVKKQILEEYQKSLGPLPEWTKRLIADLGP